MENCPDKLYIPVSLH